MKASPRTLAVVALVAAAVAGVYLARHILVPFVMSAVIAYTLHPVVAMLERRGLRRTWGAFVVMVSLLIVLAGAMLAVVPEMIEQVRLFAERVPGYAQEVQERLAPLTAWLEQRFPGQIESIRARASESAGSVLPSLAGWIAAGLKGVVSSAVSLIIWCLTIVVVPVFVYYLLVDYRDIHATIESLVPESARAGVQARVDQIDLVLRAWLKGQLTVAAVLAVIYAAGLMVIGVPLALLLGVAGGLANMVPYMGLVVGYLPAVLLAFLDTGDWKAPLMVTVVFVAGQVLEGTVISPRIVGSGLGLPPAVVLLAVFVGGELFGFTGLLLAVPATAASLVLLRDLRRSFDSPLDSGAVPRHLLRPARTIARRRPRP